MVQTEFATIGEEIEETRRQLEAGQDAVEADRLDEAMTHVDAAATIMEANGREGSAAALRRFETMVEEDDVPEEIEGNESDVFTAWLAQLDMIEEMVEAQAALGGGS